MENQAKGKKRTSPKTEKKPISKPIKNKAKKTSASEKAKYDDMRQIEWSPFDPYSD